MQADSSEYSSDFDRNLISKYEEMLSSRKSYFFDVDDIEQISDFYLEQGNGKKARRALSHGLAMHPGSPALLLKEAQAFMVEKQPRKALRILTRLEASEPLNTELLLLKAVVHRNLSDHEATRTCLLKVLETSPEHKEDIFLDLAFEQEMLNDYEGAISSLKQSLEINPSHEASIFELAYCYEMADLLEEGMAYFEAYLDEHPYSFVGWYNLALCCERSEKWEEALRAIDFSLAIREDFYNAYIIKGNVHNQNGDPQAAIDAYRESLTYDSENPMVFAAIGDCYEQLDHEAEAERYYLLALAIEPAYGDALAGMGSLRTAQLRYREAAKFYKSALAHEESNLDYWHMYASCLVDARLTQQAEQVYLSMTEQFKDDEETWIALAELTDSIYGSAAAREVISKGKCFAAQTDDLLWHEVKYLLLNKQVAEAEDLLHQLLAAQSGEGGKYLVDIYPECLLLPNVADILALYNQARSTDEL